MKQQPSCCRVRSTAAWVWTDADRPDVQRSAVATDIPRRDEVVVEVEVAVLAREQSADGAQLSRRPYPEPWRHFRGEMRNGAPDVAKHDGVPDGARPRPAARGAGVVPPSRAIAWMWLRQCCRR